MLADSVGDPHVVLTLEVEPGSEPIRGKLSVGGESSRSFFGWLELVSLIETRREALGKAAPTSVS